MRKYLAELTDPELRPKDANGVLPLSELDYMSYVVAEAVAREEMGSILNDYIEFVSSVARPPGNPEYAAKRNLSIFACQFNVPEDAEKMQRYEMWGEVLGDVPMGIVNKSVGCLDVIDMFTVGRKSIKAIQYGEY